MKALRNIFIALSLCALTSCSPGYVLEAAYFQCKILWCRRDISQVIADPLTPASTATKLEYVQRAKDFSKEIGLEPGGSFSKFTALDRDVLSWIVMGAKKDSFTLGTWWFPIVGSVPYKGFFDKDDAIELAKDLESKGLETWVRGTDAYSTLGWFNDPVLSTTLRRSVPEIVETVIHETLHSTLWIPGSVDFNESLANFVGLTGAINYFQAESNECLRVKNLSCSNQAMNFLASANENKERAILLEGILSPLYEKLEALYSSALSSEEKIKKREEVFAQEIAPFRAKFPSAKSFRSINNAEIMQARIYLTNLALFQSLYEQTGRELPKFIEKIKEIFSEDKIKKAGDTTPYDLVKGAIQSVKR